ncbi:hypothetical protein [Streptomyces sp. NPDC002490]|uniref:hypothetical protein n=1 Tax=Streptomyces sp. NPDC002490 TaxID=3154416 RepID=UPI003323E3E1
MDIKFRKIAAKSGEEHTLTLPVETRLADVRRLLEKARFITPDGAGESGPKYRFLEVRADSRQDFKTTAGSIDPNLEDELDLKKVLHLSGNGVRSVNVVDIVAASPALVGLSTDSFVNHYLRVTVILNNSANGREENAKLKGAFEPVMLTDARPADPMKASKYDNVCIALEGSVVEFVFTSWACAGYEGELRDGYDSFIDYGYAVPDKPGSWVTMAEREYSDSGKMITVVGEKKDTSGDIDINLQKVVVKARRVFELTVGDKKTTDHSTPPEVPEYTSATVASGAASSAAAAPPHGNTVVIIPPDDQHPGKLVPSKHKSGDNSGGTVDPGDTEDWEKGSKVEISFFVVKSVDEAHRIIDFYNAPPAT